MEKLRVRVRSDARRSARQKVAKTLDRRSAGPGLLMAPLPLGRRLLGPANSLTGSTSPAHRTASTRPGARSSAARPAAGGRQRTRPGQTRTEASEELDIVAVHHGPDGTGCR